MPEGISENSVREVLNALNSHNTEAVLSLFSEDVVWVTPNGTFKGKGEARRYLDWLAEAFKDFRLTESGNGVLVKDNLAIIEHDISGTIDGEPINYLALCAYEFDENEKVKALRTVFDRLALAEQAADKWLSKTVVHSVVKRVQEGLDK